MNAMMEADMTIAKALLAVTLAGLGALAVYADETPSAQSAEHYPGVGLGTLLQPLEN